MCDLSRSVNRPRLRNRLLLLCLCGLVLGCGPSHLPHPLALPGAAIGTAVENATYGARRGKVKAHVTEQFDPLLVEIAKGGGPMLSKAYNLARVPASKREALTALLKDDPRLRTDPEALTVSLMVHSS